MAHHAEFRDDLADRLFFLNLLGDEPLKLGHGGEDFFAERQLVQSIDLPAHALFLSEHLLEDLEER
jgi:hypothetical protein